MREIKFRAWHIKRKVMYNVGNMTLRNDWIGANALDILKNESSDTIGVNYFDLSHLEFHLMQFTGLYDKNKKEIYEGDILRIKLPLGGFWGNQQQERIGVVRYEADYGGYIVEWEYSINQHHVNLNCDIAFEGEIIGNKYENQELL